VTTPAKATKAARGRPAKAAVMTNGADPVATIRAALEQLDAELAGHRAFKAAMAKAFGQTAP
jgi:hypothetical protein